MKWYGRYLSSSLLFPRPFLKQQRLYFVLPTYEFSVCLAGYHHPHPPQSAARDPFGGPSQAQRHPFKTGIPLHPFSLLNSSFLHIHPILCCSPWFSYSSVLLHITPCPRRDVTQHSNKKIFDVVPVMWSRIGTSVGRKNVSEWLVCTKTDLHERAIAFITCHVTLLVGTQC